MHLVRRDGTQRSQSYLYSIMGFTDSSQGIEYVQCRGTCYHTEKRLGCHVDCDNIISPKNFTQIVEVTAPDFEPPPIADKQRLRWLRFWLTSILRTTTKYRLPLEICTDVAAGVLDKQYGRRLAVWYADTRCAETKKDVSRVSTSEKIYIRHTYFEGVQYVAGLTNRAHDSRDSLVFDPDSQTPTHYVHVANDHLGIRALLLGGFSGDFAIEKKPDVWWKTVSLTMLGSFIQAQSDVSEHPVCGNSPELLTRETRV